MKDYKAYIFDMDLTLINSIETSIKSYIKSYEICGYKFNKDDVFRNLKESLPTTYNRFPNPKATYTEFRDAFIDEAMKTFLNSTFYDDSIRYLKYLKEHNKIIGIVTNREIKNVIDILKQNNLYNMVSSIISCEKVKNLKPNPEPIIKCLEELKLDAKDCVYIGDAKNDFIASTSAGVDYIEIERYNNCDFSCDTIIHSFDELI